MPHWFEMLVLTSHPEYVLQDSCLTMDTDYVTKTVDNLHPMTRKSRLFLQEGRQRLVEALCMHRAHNLSPPPRLKHPSVQAPTINNNINT